MNERKHPTAVILLSVALAVTVFLLGLCALLFSTVFRMVPADTLLELSAVRYLIDRNYIFEYDEAELSNRLISGMVEGLGDPYSVYRSQEEHEAFLYNAMGEFGGVGIVMSLDDAGERTYVLQVYEDTPAEDGGVLEGDQILAVDGEPVTTDIDATAGRVRGTVGSKVTITFYRESEDSTFDKTFRREEIEMETTESRMLSDDVGYLRISAFNHGTAEETLNAIEALENDGAAALVLDLRDNAGGSVDAVEQIADYLLDEGVIYSVIRKDGRETTVESDAEQNPLPICILVNDGSASASELLCGALRDRGRARVVGETTFGKGIMQNQYQMTGGVLTLTFAEYATPNGTRIHEKGITPDVVVSLSEEDRYRWPNLSFEEDPQLQVAFEELR